MNNIQQSFGENVNFTFTPINETRNSTFETITADSLNDLSNNIMSSLSNSTNIYSTILGSANILNTPNSENMEDNVKITIKDDERKNLKYLKYSELTEDYCIKNNIIKTTECTFCLDKFNDDDNILVTKCKHIFHKCCIDNWLSNYSVKCPICKNKIVEGKPEITNS